jgi:hypothetical protein
MFVVSRTRSKKTSMKDLAPEIYRQRTVIEGYPKHQLTAREIKKYLSQLSGVLEMRTLIEPVTHRSPTYGEAGWIHWESSGAHFYAWDHPRLFFSVDIYTCKPYEAIDAVKFTKTFFDTEAIEYKEF